MTASRSSGKRPARRAKFRQIGWTGFTDDKAYFCPMTDSYCNDGEQVFATDIFRSKKAARKRFEDVREVFVRERGPRRKR